MGGLVKEVFVVLEFLVELEHVGDETVGGEEVGC
jgi:hypothetical protein